MSTFDKVVAAYAVVWLLLYMWIAYKGLKYAPREWKNRSFEIVFYALVLGFAWPITVFLMARKFAHDHGWL